MKLGFRAAFSLLLFLPPSTKCPILCHSHALLPSSSVSHAWHLLQLLCRLLHGAPYVIAHVRCVPIWLQGGFGGGGTWRLGPRSSGTCVLIFTGASGESGLLLCTDGASGPILLTDSGSCPLLLTDSESGSLLLTDGGSGAPPPPHRR